MALEVVMDLMQPRMVQRIVDDGIAQFDMAVVINTGLLMIGYALIGVVGGIGGNVFTELSTQGFEADLRSALFRKTQSLSFGNLDDLETGQLITRLTNDVTQVREMVALMLRAMVRTPGMLIGSIIMAILTSPAWPCCWLYSRRWCWCCWHGSSTRASRCSGRSRKSSIT